MMVEMNELSEEELEETAESLQLLLLDVDGVFTDGSIIYSGESTETKSYDVKDGMGITMAQRAGIDVGIVTGRVSDVVRRRASELGIERVYQGYDWKDEALDTINENTSFKVDRMAFMGDDILDLAIMQEVGLSLTPGDAHQSVRDRSDLQLNAPGGRGAIREAIDYLLELRDQKEEIYNYYSRGYYNPDEGSH